MIFYNRYFYAWTIQECNHRLTQTKATGSVKFRLLLVAVTWAQTPIATEGRLPLLNMHSPFFKEQKQASFFCLPSKLLLSLTLNTGLGGQGHLELNTIMTQYTFRDFKAVEILVAGVDSGFGSEIVVNLYQYGGYIIYATCLTKEAVEKY